MNSVRKPAVILLFLLCMAYVVSPYYASYQLIQAISSGSEEEMKKRIDFPAVRDSVKQQLDASLDSQQLGDPLAQSMFQAFKPALEHMVDDLLKPQYLASFIQSGKLQKKRPASKTPNDKAPEDVSWSAFFDRHDRFKIRVDNLALYLQFQNWAWQLVAIGADDLLNLNQKNREQKPVEEELATEQTQAPKPLTNLSTLQSQYKDSFFIHADSGTQASVQADLFLLSDDTFKTARLLNIKGYDAEGNVNTRDYTEQEEEMNRNNSSFVNGVWTENVYKTTPDKNLNKLEATFLAKVPAQVESYEFGTNDMGQLITRGNSAVTLTAMENGQVTLSLYRMMAKREYPFTVVCLNEAGQQLKIMGTSEMSPQDPILLPGSTQSFYASNRTIRVAGTPHKVLVYFVSENAPIEIDFEAHPKPETSFGELKSPIRKTRYAVPKTPPALSEVTRQELNGIKTAYKQELTYDGKERRFLHFTLPAFANNYFAEFDYSNVKVSLNGQDVSYEAERSQNGQNSFKVYFGKPDAEWGYTVELDAITGKAILKYPSKIITKRINQGESQGDLSLRKHTFTAPKDDSILRYNEVWPVVSARAYDGSGKEIKLLDNAGFWAREKGSKVIYWGNPEYVEYKEVAEWLSIEVPINKTSADLEIVKQ